MKKDNVIAVTATNIDKLPVDIDFDYIERRIRGVQVLVINGISTIMGKQAKILLEKLKEGISFRIKDKKIQGVKLLEFHFDM